MTWTAFLGTGTSGRAGESAERPRFSSPGLQAVHWGARPTLAGDEIAVATHAGFAAGVDPSDGTVRWARALPRYPPDQDTMSSVGFGGRNAPLSLDGNWAFACLDSPRLLLLERGTGRLAWMDEGEAADGAWSDLLAADSAGELRLRGFAQPVRIRSGGGVPEILTGSRWESFGAGRALDLGPWIVRWEPGEGLRAARWDGDEVAELHLVEGASAFLEAADLTHSDGQFLAVGNSRAWAFGSRTRLLEHLSRERTGESTPGRRAALDAIAARLEGDGVRLAAALRDVLASGDLPAIEAAAGQVVAWCDLATEVVGTGESSGREAAGARALATLVPLLPPGARGEACLRVSGLLQTLEEGAVLVGLHDRWIERGGDGHLAWGEDRIREDLVAREWLDRAWTLPGGGAAFRAREERHARAVDALLGGPIERLAAAVDRAAGTPAAERGRLALARRLVEAGRDDDAAAHLSQLRTALASRLSGAAGEERRARAAVWMLEEALALERAGDPLAAREIADALLPWAPEGTSLADGTTPALLADRLRSLLAWRPLSGDAGSLELWPQGVPTATADLRSVLLPAVEEAGGSPERDRLVVARGVSLEVWSARGRDRVADLGSRDGGWLGVTLRDVEEWLPDHGILLPSIVAGEPADRAGILSGDWLLEWGGEPVRSVADFVSRVSSSVPGVEVPVRVVRHGEVVASRVVPGLRPDDAAAGVDRARVRARPDGRLVVPVRTGLLLVDLAAGSERWLWRHEGPGAVRRVLHRGSRVFVAVGRSWERDLIVAVDARDGREVWRREVTGLATHMAASGPGLVVETDLRPALHLLDIRTGSLLAEIAISPRYRDNSSRSWIPARGWGVSAGRLWTADALTGASRRDLATGIEDWAPAEVSMGGFGSSVAAGAFVAVLGDAVPLTILAQDPLTAAPPVQVPLDHRTLLADQDHWGPIDENARVLVAGDVLYLARCGRAVVVESSDGAAATEGGADLFVIHLDWETVRAAGEGGSVDAGIVRSKARMLTGRAVGDPILVDFDATPEGAFLTAIQVAEGFGLDRREVIWFSGHRDGVEEPRPMRLEWRFGPEEAVEMRRPGPTRVGDRVWFATDRGARSAPVHRFGG